MFDHRVFMVCDYEYEREQKRLKVNCRGCFYGSSLEDFEICMSRTMDKLIEVGAVGNIVLSANREFEYSYAQTKMLKEVASAIKSLTRTKKLFAVGKGPDDCERCIPERISFIQNIVGYHLKRDPIGAYVRLTRDIKYNRQKAKNSYPNCAKCYNDYINHYLLIIKDAIDKTEMIQRVMDRLTGYHVGSREIYRELFHPTIKPNFMLTKYMTTIPIGATQIDRYFVDKTEVQCLRIPGRVNVRYHVTPPEFNLRDTEYTILDTARRYMAAHKPNKSEFTDPERTREIFYNIGRDMITDISDTMKITLSPKKIDELAEILTRYTAGFGMLEVILADENVQDLFLNAPVGQMPFFLFHGKHEECDTNIIPTHEDAEAWSTRFRIASGRPLDEANPVLDTEIELPSGRVRVGAITNTLSPDGLALALRRHRDKPWTYQLMMSANMMTPLAAGLLSFIVDGARTMLFAGTRSSGKTSMLGATLTEIMKRYRILTVEDTLELPVEALADMGYNIVRLKSRSVITHVEIEVPTDEAIRTSLRLGDSCLIIGEVRSVEAKALYEAMRIGALANVVAGTIHGDSPYGVFDRVVNDLGVQPTSFKATDVIVMNNRLRSADGLHTFRRMISITEITKEWNDDPQKEKAFVPLMEYNAKSDILEPSETFLNGESYLVNEIANRVKEWRDNWEAVWDNIQLRAKVKETLVGYARKTEEFSILEADFTTDSNDQFHVISERVKDEYGTLDSQRIFARWNEWVKNEIRERKGRYPS